MSGLPLTINGSYKSAIYLCCAKLTTNAEYQPFSLPPYSELTSSYSVILINSVYLSAAIIENGPYIIGDVLKLRG